MIILLIQSYSTVCLVCSDISVTRFVTKVHRVIWNFHTAKFNVAQRLPEFNEYTSDRDTMAKGLTRALEWLFVLYFGSHILATIFIDSQAIMPSWLYPQLLLDLVKNYTVYMKDDMMAAPSSHPWFLSFVYGECLLQLPFFFVATYAFYKGSCKWVRIPAIIYSVHTATTLQAILAHIYWKDFTSSAPPVPANFQERLRLSAIYLPYFVVPIMILLVMLLSSEYTKPVIQAQNRAQNQGSSRVGRPKKNKSH